MVQHNAGKFITNTYIRKGNFEKFSITKILNDIKFKTLEQRRTQARLIMAYKIIKGQLILQPDLLPKIHTSRPTRKCKSAKVGKEYQLVEPISTIHAASKTFFYSIPKVWNETVSNKQANAPSADAFKEHF